MDIEAFCPFASKAVTSTLRGYTQLWVELFHVNAVSFDGSE